MKIIFFRILKILLIFFLILSCDRRNGIVQITGVLENIPDSTIIKVSKSVNENPENYLFMSDTMIVLNNSFKKTVRIKGVGIITLAPTKYSPKINMIIEDGEKINLEIKKYKNSFKVDFKDKNKIGQSLFHESKLFSNNYILDKIINNIAPSARSNRDLINRIELLKDSLLNPFSDLLHNGKITTSFYEVAKAEGEGRFLSSVNDALLYNIKSDSFKIFNYNRDEIIRYFFNKYDPYSIKYKNINTLTRNSNVSKKGILISKGKLEGKRKLTQLWDSSQIVNSYAPIKIQQIIKANYIAFDILFKTKSIEQIEKEFNLFKKTFPNSVYINNLTYYFNKNENENIAPYTFGVLKKNGVFLIDEKTVNMNNLDSLIKTKFNYQFVFVDIWATWCSPCINEFAYSKKLTQFLNKKNIKILYVSIDSKNAGVKWKNELVKYSLEGHHFFATNDLNNYFKNLEISNSIPKYILFNKQGEILDNNLPRPSSNNDLYDRINELIKTSDLNF